MDTLKIKNKLANWLTFENTEHLSLSPAIDRISGSIWDIKRYKKQLFHAVNKMFKDFESRGFKVEFVDEEADKFKFRIREPKFHVSDISSHKVNKSLVLVNGLPIWSAKTFPIYDCHIEHDPNYINEIVSRHFSYTKLDLQRNDITVIFTNPKIYYDYFTNGFKVSFELRDLTIKSKPAEVLAALDAEIKENNKKTEEYRKLSGKMMEKYYASRYESVEPIPNTTYKVTEEGKLEKTEDEKKNKSGFDGLEEQLATADRRDFVMIGKIKPIGQNFERDAPYCKRIDSITEELLNDPCVQAEMKEVNDFKPVVQEDSDFS